MTTINISLPQVLKNQAQQLVKSGYYASFSDLVRDSLRQTIKQNQYDLMANQAKKELKEGQATVLDSDQDIDQFTNSL